MCYFNRGTPQDYVESHKWLNLASSRFLPDESEKRGRAIKNRVIVAQKLTPVQIAEAQRLAREWRPRQSAPIADTQVDLQSAGPSTGDAPATTTASALVPNGVEPQLGPAGRFAH